MKTASLAYKRAMAKQFRDKSYALVSVGVVSKDAQNNATIDNVLYLSNSKSVLKLGEVLNTYASLEECHTKADGSYIFPPEDDEFYQQRDDVGVVATVVSAPIRVDFNLPYDIKGLTINFGDSYPTSFTISNGLVTYEYELDSPEFTCTDSFDSTEYLIITPISFEGSNNKRLRINYILMGVGIVFDNESIVELSMSQSVSYVSEELPSISTSVKVIDKNRMFNVDDPTSFINYLADGQPLEMSLGQTLEDGSVEFVELPTTYLSSWGANGLYMSFSTTDRFKLLDGKYSAGNSIHTRTLYDDALAVLTDAGLEPDEYYIDTVLQDITVSNPLPTASYAECLQYIANAGRCRFKQSLGGKIIIEGGFEAIIEPTELTVTANSEAGWSNASNTRFGSNIVYADFTPEFVPANGSMLFIPESSSEYLEDTTFVSSEIADENGLFTVNPTITMELPATFSFYGFQMLFNGNAPTEMTLEVYRDSTLLKRKSYEIGENPQYISEDMLAFNKLVLIFTKGHPYNRILVNKISLGELTDYVLDRDSMKENPVGTMDKRVKDVQVKVFSFNPPESEGQDPQVVEDSVFATTTINSVGQTITFENQLIGTMEHAQTVADWLANYYANQISYQVNYRGDPRLDASDIIYLESEKLNNLQVEIESLDLKFNGAYSGKLNLRRATNMLPQEGDED